MKSLSRAPPMSPWTLSCGLCSSSPSSPRPLCLNGVRPPPKPGEPPVCVPTKLLSRNAASSETDRGSSLIGPPDWPVDPYRATTKSGLVPPSGHVCDPNTGGRSSRLRLLVIVVPVGQRPVGWPAKLRNRGSDDPLECAQIAAVPGKEIPGVMLALVAVLAPKRGCIRQALARLYVAVAAPELLGDTVHRGEIPPACHVAERLRARTTGSCRSSRFRASRRRAVSVACVPLPTPSRTYWLKNRYGRNVNTGVTFFAPFLPIFFMGALLILRAPIAVRSSTQRRQ